MLRRLSAPVRVGARRARGHPRQDVLPASDVPAARWLRQVAMGAAHDRATSIRDQIDLEGAAAGLGGVTFRLPAGVTTIPRFGTISMDSPRATSRPETLTWSIPPGAPIELRLDALRHTISAGSTKERSPSRVAPGRAPRASPRWPGELPGSSPPWRDCTRTNVSGALTFSSAGVEWAPDAALDDLQ